MLFTVSAKASSFGGFPNIGSTKNVTASGFGQNTQINLIICTNEELMAGSHYPETERSLPKTGLLLFIILLPYYVPYYRVFRSTSTWKEYDKAMKINREQWLDYPYPETGRRGLHLMPLKRSSGRAKTKKNMAEKKKPCDYSSDSPPILMVQYRGNQSQTLAKKSARYHQCADNSQDKKNKNLYALPKILLFQ